MYVSVERTTLIETPFHVELDLEAAQALVDMAQRALTDGHPIEPNVRDLAHNLIHLFNTLA